MNTPNLDALAKLGPFTADDRYCYPSDEFTLDSRCEGSMWSMRGGEECFDIAAALNEWVDLRATVAELRAALTLETHKVITCGVAATNPDAALTLRHDYMRWNSPQAEAVRKLRAERDDLRALLELVAGSLLAAQEKRGDAPMASDAHIDEAVSAIKHCASGDSYSEAARSLRAKLWSVSGEMQKELAELCAYRERTEAALRDLCCFSDTFEKDRLKRRGLWRDPAPKEASDGK